MHANLRAHLAAARVTRPLWGAAVCVAAMLVAAAPAAAAPAAPPTTPTRIVHTLSPFTIDAGYGCAFDVAGQPSFGFVARTTLPDGRIQTSVRAHGAYVNVQTGASFPTADNFRALDQIDSATGIDTVVANGELTATFLPGDDGPFGPVTEASFYKFVGTVSFTYNLNTGQTTNFHYRGTVEDVCAALS
jgi:hypothetical protein